MRTLYRTHRRLTLAAAAGTIAVLIAGGIALAQTVVGPGTTFISPVVTANSGESVDIAEAAGFLFKLRCDAGETAIDVENVSGGDDSHFDDNVNGPENNDFDEGEVVVMNVEDSDNSSENGAYGIIGTELPGSILHGQSFVVDRPATDFDADCNGGITILFGPRPGQVSRGG